MCMCLPGEFRWTICVWMHAKSENIIFGACVSRLTCVLETKTGSSVKAIVLLTAELSLDSHRSDTMC